MIEQIAEKDFDLDAFVELTLREEAARDELVHHMVSNADIMIYYHCYYVVSKASSKYPEVFYKYWDVIARLLHHKNSYHRDFALTILGNLVAVDHEDRFAELKEDYFSLVNDEKFMTGNSCVVNLVKIYRNKPALREEIINTLLDLENRVDYTEKQIAVLKSDVLVLFDQFYADIPDKEEIHDYIRACTDSLSPKTRKMAKGLVKKYNLA